MKLNLIVKVHLQFVLQYQFEQNINKFNESENAKQTIAVNKPWSTTICWGYPRVSLQPITDVDRVHLSHLCCSTIDSVSFTSRPIDEWVMVFW